MTNQQFDEVEELIQASPIKSGECPTCGAKAMEVAPGITEWGKSTYRYLEKDHECNCEEQEALFRHYLLARIPQEYMNLGEDSYFGDLDALAEVKKYLDNWDRLRRYGMGIGFYSKTQGTGKTFLAMMIARDLVKRGESVYCVFFRRMVEIYSVGIDQKARQSEEKNIRDCTALILDEISPPVSEAQHALFSEKFEELIRHRSNYNKVTILTTNLTPDELSERYYPRTYSLLAAKEQSIYVNGTDVRKEHLNSLNRELALNGEARPII